MRQPLPDRVGVDGLEDKWRGVWDESGVYKFQGTRDRKAVYSIDTPPPTVSGHLHVGHVFSYTHTDVIARFKRMNGYDVFYPMGWDDNGLPTERRVQNYYGVRVDTSLKYDPNFVPPFEGTDGKKIDAKDQVPISRKNFIELCEKLTAQDEKQFEALWRSLGLSIDWSQTYHTIGEHPQRVAQKAFLRNLARGEAYQKDAPGLWDVTFQTAVAQAELESREYPGFYHKVAFRFEDGTPIYIETTRPELLAACGALIAHPDDERYKQYFGQYVYSPLFHVKVPILAHKAAEMDKGAGIAMCCTFGDVTDVEWWRDLNLPLRSIIQRNGRIVMDTPDWIEDEEGKRIFQETAGKTTFSARKVIVDELRAAGDLDGEPTPTKRMTNFYEKGDKPLEIVTSRQWYLKNGGTDEKLNAELIARGKELNFHPDFMRVRYENWVHGLNGDWLISRQRFFGVPFPLWYPVKEDGTPDYDHPITPSEDRLPIDPTDDVPEGYTEDQRDVPGGFTAEPDIRAGRLHRRAGHHGYLGHLVAHPADRDPLGGTGRGEPGDLQCHLPDGSASAGPGHHPHLAVLHHGSRASREQVPAVGQHHAVGLDPRSGPQEDVEVQGQRGRAGQADQTVRRRRGALLGRRRTSGPGRHVRRRPDEDRPSSCHQAAQRHQVRASHRP